MPFLLRPLFARLRPSIAIGSYLVALWFATTDPRPWWVILIGLAGTAAALLPYDAASRFRRADAILIPTFATCFLAMIDIAPSWSLSQQAAVAAAVVLVARLAAGSPDCFALAPLGLLLQAHVNALHIRHFGWPPLLIAALTPPILRFLLRPSWRRRLRWSVAFVIYPIVVLAFASATSKLGAEGKPHGDLFEDAHRFVPASEMLRGKKPYLDIVPAHGFIEDGLLDYVVMRSGAVTEGRLAKVHGVISSLDAVAYYAVAAAATGSPHVGLLAYFLAVAFGLGGGMLRILPAMAALACMVAAVRNDRPRYLAYAGALVVLAGLTSLDFGVYSFVALIAAVLVMRESRRRAAVAAAIGTAAASVALAIALVSSGILVAFVRTTLVEVLPAGVTATIGIPALTKSFPELLTSIFTPRGFALLALPIFLVALTVIRNRAVTVMAVFMIAAGVYFVERQQFYFAYALPPLVVTATFFLFRRAKQAAVAVLIIVIVAANVTGALIAWTTLWKARGPLAPDEVEIMDVPRARGALFGPGDVRLIEDVDRYARARLGSDGTFFDFAGKSNLYFLLDRECPIRQVAVPFFESEPLQREVIARIDRNPRVRAALVPADPDAGGIDGVPNSVRAPLVWEYLRQHYEPETRAGDDVVIWRRR